MEAEAPILGTAGSASSRPESGSVLVQWPPGTSTRSEGTLRTQAAVLSAT